MICCFDCLNCTRRVEYFATGGELGWQNDNTKIAPQRRRRTIYNCKAGHWPATICHRDKVQAQTRLHCENYDV